jgi:hypothetical protein
MSNYDQMGMLHDTAGNLVAVRYSIYDAGPDGQDWIDAVEIRFEGGTLTVREGCYVKSATTVKPWIATVGRSPTWIWLLTNQQGYEDGLRFEFSMSQQQEELNVITLVVIASGIQIFSCHQSELSVSGGLDDTTA